MFELMDVEIQKSQTQIIKNLKNKSLFNKN